MLTFLVKIVFLNDQWGVYKDPAFLFVCNGSFLYEAF